MAAEGKNSPFFSAVNEDLDNNAESPDRALEELIAREPVLYKKTLFRAFLGYSSKECDKMTIQNYMDSSVILQSVLKLWHAPFMKHNS